MTETSPPESGRARQDPGFFYERFAPEFDSRMNQYEVNKRIGLVFDSLLSSVELPGRLLLDAGCGTGLFSREAVRRGAVVTSMDVGEQLLEQVARKTDSTRVVGDLMALPFPDDHFDVVLCTEAIEHTRNPLHAVHELARVLAPGGRLALTTPNRIWHWSLAVAHVLKVRPYEGFENWVRYGELRAAAVGAGLRVEKMFGFNPLPFVHPLIHPANDWFERFGERAWGRYMINMALLASKRP
jgi:2-polyprenyl-3-methyl-5-hydroxy-6-metoxy-1,4-benzoquinol methylase